MKRPIWFIAGGVGTAAVAAVIAVLWLAPELVSDQAGPGTEMVAAGRSLYRTHCASCHGINLEGQPDWQTPLPSGRLPAPPHDATGHTWHHPDGMLLRITREGPAAIVGAGYESDMPGFGDLFTDTEIRSIFEFIKSTWPEREREYQAEMTRRERGAE